MQPFSLRRLLPSRLAPSVDAPSASAPRCGPAIADPALAALARKLDLSPKALRPLTPVFCASVEQNGVERTVAVFSRRGCGLCLAVGECPAGAAPGELGEDVANGEGLLPATVAGLLARFSREPFGPALREALGRHCGPLSS
jgi:hypothetical protein